MCRWIMTCLLLAMKLLEQKEWDGPSLMCFDYTRMRFCFVSFFWIVRSDVIVVLRLFFGLVCFRLQLLVLAMSDVFES